MAYCSLCGGTMVCVSGSIVKCEYCGRLFSTSNGEVSAADPERLYNDAVRMAKSSNEETLKSAIEAFEALGAYKDSSALANSCRGMIAKSRLEAEEQRLAAERQAELERIANEKRMFEQKQKAKIIGGAIAAVSAVAVIAVVISVSSNSKKVASYNEAIELYSMGKYEEAQEQFGELGDYSDAATYVSTIANFLAEREAIYEKGVSYYEKGAYSECITALTEIPDYLDAADYMEKSVEAIYQQAAGHYNAGEYEKAKELLYRIPADSSKSMDAEMLVAEIEEIIVEQAKAATYESAKNSYDSGDYETAQRLFISISGYQDAQTYLGEIGTSYYNKAKELFNQKDYVQCGDVLQYIDTLEEWNEYSVANELLASAKQEYENAVIIEGKNICRKDGYTKMSSYIDSSVCVILSQADATVLKEECNIEIVSLISLEPYTYGVYALGPETSASARIDTMGNSYSAAFRGYMDESNGESSCTYCIDKKYLYLTATVAVRKKDNISDKATGIIRIYGDGRLLWSDENIKKDTKPYDIKIDISNVTDLKIEMYGSGNMGWQGISSLLCNPMLSE